MTVMPEKEIINPIKNSESEILELKESTGEWKAIIKTISAFANTRGGAVVVGISDKGEITGVRIGKRTIEDLTNKIKENTDPKIFPGISVENINGESIILIKVEESLSKPLFAFDRAYKRVGKSTVRATSEEIRKMALEGKKIYWDELSCEEANLKDIDKEKVSGFLKEAKRERNLNIPADTPIDEALMRLNLLRDGKPTNASILLFGKQPQKYFLQAEVRCVRFKGNEPIKPFIDMKVISEDIVDQVNKSLGFVLEHIPKAVWLAGKPQREERYQYPPDAIRETIVNAICHRNYEERGNIQIRIFDDYLEVWSPGELPKPLTPEDLKKTHKSIPRNPLIARQFFLIKFVEEVGTGTNDMINYCKEWKIPEPEFKHVTGDFVVTFRGKITEKYLISLGLNGRQIRAVEYVKKQRKITNNEYQKLNNVSKRTATNDLRELVEKNILKYMGKGKRDLRYVMK